MKKTGGRGQIFALFLLCGVVLWSACGQEADLNGPFQTSYLGGSDAELVQGKGKGTENIAVVDGKKVILSRVYQEEFFGYDSELTVMLSSDGRVEYALYSLAGEREAVAAAISAALGKEAPDRVEEGTPGIGYQALWRQKPYLYTMIAGENGVTVAVIKE